MAKACKNCEELFNTQYEFCPHCGMQSKDDLTVGVLFYNTISNYFSFDARFLKSFFPLLFKPGFLAEKFIQGKRLLFLHPAQMYLFITVVFFFLFSFVTRDTVKEVDKGISEAFKETKVAVNEERSKEKDSLARLELRKTLKANQFLTRLSDAKIDSIVNNKNLKKNEISFDFNSKEVDSLIAINAPREVIYAKMGMAENAGYLKRKLYDQLFKFYKQKSGGSILQAFYDSIPIALFILLPIFALILKLFYRKRGSFAHHLVFSFYFFSFLFTVFSIILIMRFVFTLPGWVRFLMMLSTFIYLVLAIKQFYKQGLGLSFVKSGIISFIYLLIVIPIAVFIMSVLAFFTY